MLFRGCHDGIRFGVLLRLVFIAGVFVLAGCADDETPAPAVVVSAPQPVGLKAVLMSPPLATQGVQAQPAPIQASAMAAPAVRVAPAESQPPSERKSNSPEARRVVARPLVPKAGGEALAAQSPVQGGLASAPPPEGTRAYATSQGLPPSAQDIQGGRGPGGQSSNPVNDLLSVLKGRGGEAALVPPARAPVVSDPPLESPAPVESVRASVSPPPSSSVTLSAPGRVAPDARVRDAIARGRVQDVDPAELGSVPARDLKNLF